MVFNPWIEKAWQLHHQAERVPNVTILKSALCRERKYREAPGFQTAAIISVHYLVLALRKQTARRAMMFGYYMSQALSWRREAIRWLARSSAEPHVTTDLVAH